MMRITLFFLAYLVLTGCGPGNSGEGDTTDTNPIPWRLVSAEEDSDNDGTTDRMAGIRYGDTDTKIEKVIDNQRTRYTYDEAPGGKKSPALADGATRVCTILVDDGLAIEKQFRSQLEKHPADPEFIIYYDYDSTGTVVSERHTAIDDQGESTLAVITYRHAFRDASQTELIPVYKHYVSDVEDIRIYFRYSPGMNQPDTIEYDLNDDYNIDYITRITYDAHGNRARDVTVKLSGMGDEHVIRSVTYTWEEGNGDDRDIWELWDDGLGSGLPTDDR